MSINEFNSTCFELLLDKVISEDKMLLGDLNINTTWWWGGGGVYSTRMGEGNVASGGDFITYFSRDGWFFMGCFQKHESPFCHISPGNGYGIEKCFTQIS